MDAGGGGQDSEAGVTSRGSSAHICQLVINTCWGMPVLSLGSNNFCYSLTNNFCNCPDSEMSQMDGMADVVVMEVDLQRPGINWTWHKAQE